MDASSKGTSRPFRQDRGKERNHSSGKVGCLCSDGAYCTSPGGWRVMDAFIIVLLCAISFSAGNLFQLLLRKYIKEGGE